MKNYPLMLMRRARQAMPRQQAEEVSTALQQRNAAALLAWRIRWAQHCPLPDAWPEAGRRYADLYFMFHRGRAAEWLAHKAQPVRLLRDLTLRGRAK